ncbi:ATP-grasp fold amidoligase family protein [Zobellia barbeyronii]|uniref:Glycosyl transferase n=1 Tax=Zobellia barbeyronii TaxID=2748009 RepID=A0ABS5WIG9_9FLAO|nr:ATP-grasp fold amidoligase family protein [Zobellia barbeyronii]MBT2163204.1 glycosyl transferase [Zobellia barbeyronii]
MGKNLSLEDPKTLNEKISWLKLNDRTSLHTLCSDKYAVRQYIIEKIGDDFVVPLFFMTLNYREIILENLPDEPSIIKTNHDSGGGIFVYNKNELDYNKVQIILRKRMAINYYQRSNEWQYKNIVPCIIVEKLLQTKEGEIPKDYKLHCFNGKVRMISVDIDRGSENHKRNWYNKEWVREPYKWSSPKGNGRYTDPSTNDTPKPRTLNQMIELSETLSEPFVYVRVDWYDVDGKLFFGEMTFYHDGGNRPILPEKWDLELGSELHLNI